MISEKFLTTSEIFRNFLVERLESTRNQKSEGENKNNEPRVTQYCTEYFDTFLYLLEKIPINFIVYTSTVSSR